MEKIISKYLCYQCISNNYLRTYIQEDAKLNTCTFCNLIRECISLEYLADWIDKIFHKNYISLSIAESHNKHIKNEVVNEMNASCIIEIMLGSDSTIAKQIVDYLIEKYSSIDKGSKDYFNYKETFEEIPVADIKYSKYWTAFCQNIKHH